MSGTRRDWVAEMADLTAAGPDWPADAAADAERSAAALIALARALVAGGAVPPVCGTRHVCALAEIDPPLCDLVRDLARLPTRPPLPAAARDAPAAFLDALADAGSTVYVCRRVLHPAGTCLFAAGAFEAAAADRCARVLLAAHRLGRSVGRA